jgi:hypothetical protein
MMNGAQRSNQQVLVESNAFATVGQQAIAAAECERTERNLRRPMEFIACLN